MTAREGDARPDLEEFESEVELAPIVHKPKVPKMYARYAQTDRKNLFSNVAAPVLTEQEMNQMSAALEQGLANNAIKYPELAQQMLADPSKLWLMAELQMMLSPQPDEIAEEWTAELMSGLTTNTAQRIEYEYHTAHEETQQLFWNEIGNQFDDVEREFLIDALAQVSARGANNVAAQALRWVDTYGLEGTMTVEDVEQLHDMSGEGVIAGIGNLIQGIHSEIAGERTEREISRKEQLMLNILTWSSMEQQYDEGQEGFFGVIESLQEGFEQNFFSPLMTAGVGIVGGADDAARRKDLTFGQKFSYIMGFDPADQAGNFGWDMLVSGGADALLEVAGDPVAWFAGIGAGAKAIKTIPVAAKATRAGRIVAAARALLPKPFTGMTRGIRGGRFARVQYALRANTIDDLLQATVKNGVAQDAMSLIKNGQIGKFSRLYPSWSGISDNAKRVIAEAVETPEDFIEVLKADALNGFMNTSETLDDLRAAASKSSRALDDAAGVGRRADIPVDTYTPEEWQLINQSTGMKPTRSSPLSASEGGVAGVAIHADQAADASLGTFKHGDETFELFKHTPDPNAPKPTGFRAQFAASLGDTELWYVRNADGDIVAGYNSRTLLNEGPKGLMHSALRASEAAGDSFLPTLARRAAEDTANFSEDGARFLSEAARQRVQPRVFDLIADESLPADLRLQAAKDQLRLNVYNGQSQHIFVISEVPLKSKRIFSLQKLIEGKYVQGEGRIATGIRRTAARLTPGRIPNDIDIFHTKQGMSDLRNLGEHFGMQSDRLDELIEQFRTLELGARQEWVWDTFMREIGRQTKVPAFEHALVQFYKGSGIRNYSASGADLIGDGKRIPILPSQLTSKLPVPVDELTEVFRRSQNLKSRKAMRILGRGLGFGETKKRREGLVKSIRHQLGEQAEGLSDEQVYNMAYSLVNPAMDGRGALAGVMLPKLSSAMGKFHTFFTKSMLIFRPIQWMWRVALMEEPIRAHLFNMPSIYTNPLQYMRSAREAFYINSARKWAATNAAWGSDVLHTLTKGSKDDILKRLTDNGLLDDIFGGNVPQSTNQVRNAVAQFVEDALYGRTRVNRLNPVKRVPWAVKNRSKNLQTAERALQRIGLPKDFSFADDASEISGRLLSVYLGETLGTTQRKLYQWQPGMSPDEAFTHGRLWGVHLAHLREDAFGRMALQRFAARLRGETPDITGHHLVNHPHWQLMAPDLRIKYANLAGDDVALAEKYLDDMLAGEINHLFKPFLDELSPDDAATLIDEFAVNAKISTEISGQAVDWNLTSANHGGGVRDVGDFARNNRQSRMAIPNNLPEKSFDPRFMAEEKGALTKLADRVLHTFGEEATQTINRRPAWLRTFERYKKQYEAIGIPPDRAYQLARDQANKMVNYVFFNMDEAPYYIARLNKKLPFFGAMYEVAGTWSYKMPVAVGGTWIQGAGETLRKFDRIIDGFVNIGLLHRERDPDTGEVTITLNLVPPDSDMLADNELGRMLQGVGYAAVGTLDSALATLIGLATRLDPDGYKEGLNFRREQGYRLAAGHPLNPTDYGILSFAQADVGLNPITNIAVSTLGAVIPGATGPTREPIQSGESIGDLAERLDVDWDELVRYNRELFVDKENFGSSELYQGLLTGEIDPESVVLPDGVTMNIPGSSLWDAFSDTFMPFGEINGLYELGASFFPSSIRWALAGMAIQSQPTDSWWKTDEFTGVFAGALPKQNQAQMASAQNEAFMFLEAHDLIDGKGPFTRIQEKEKLLEEKSRKLEAMVAAGNTDTAELEAEINRERAALDEDIQSFFNRVQKVAGEQMVMRGLTGQFLPTTPGHVRLEEQRIRDYWDTKEYADSILQGEGEVRLRNFKSIEDLYAYKEQLAAWLQDPTADRARAVFRKNNPQLMAYLTPKTFYKGGNPPEIYEYEEYQRQIEAGEREPAPLQVTMYRAYSAQIQADHYNKRIAAFGSDPLEHAANYLWNREMSQELNSERDMAYDALNMWDDMHGGVYDTWRRETYGTEEEWAQDATRDALNTIRDNLEILFELEDYLDIELDRDNLAELNSGFRGTIAELSNAIRDYNERTMDEQERNPYEEAINNYFEQVYIPYATQIADLYDSLPEQGDSERQALVYEKIKHLKNQYAGADIYMNGDTTIPFPNPLDYSWVGKDEEEREIKLQQWVTRPMEWMDQSQAEHLVEQNPELAAYLPVSDADFQIYQSFALRKIELDEMFERDEITRSQRNKGMESLDEQLRDYLIQNGREGEVRMMDATPYEKLEFAGMMPSVIANIPVNERGGILSDAVRYYKQALDAAGESPGTEQGRRFWLPLYEVVERHYYGDPQVNEALQDMGLNLQDEDTLDAFLPWLFFGYTGER